MVSIVTHQLQCQVVDARLRHLAAAGHRCRLLPLWLLLLLMVRWLVRRLTVGRPCAAAQAAGGGGSAAAGGCLQAGHGALLAIY